MNENNKPLVSIITINFNNAEGLRKTLESVCVQTSQNYEHIIIDGGSTDNSVEVIKEFLQNEFYSSRVAYWCSEKDNGIYNAMNKGVRHANGLYCLILNSADLLYDKNVIKNVTPYLDGCDMATGIMKGENFEKLPQISYSLFAYIDSYIAHGATFVKTSICKDLPYDESYKIIADYVFFYYLLCRDNLIYKTIPYVIEYFDLQGVSATRPPLQEKELDRFYHSIVPSIAWKDYEIYKHFNFFESAIQKSKFWKFIYKVCRKLIHIFMKIG